MPRLFPRPSPLLTLALLVGCVDEAPTAPRVSIGPTEARTDDDLVAVIDTVPAAETAKGEVWELSVTANDGEQNGKPGRAETTILNTAPTVTVALSPGGWGAGGRLRGWAVHAYFPILSSTLIIFTNTIASGH